MSQSKARSKLWAGINGAKGAQILTAGGTMGTGNIAFTANPTADDTITINDTVFTFVATASTATNINIKGTLALTLAEAETVIEANSTVGLTGGIVANVDVTNTDADLTFEFFGNATVTVFESSTDGANTTDTAYSAGSSVYLNTGKSQALLEWADAGSTLTYLSLPDGTVDGQLFEVYCVSEATAGDTVGVLGSFTSTNLATITGAAGDGAVFYWSASSGVWKVKSSTNTALSLTTAAAL